MWSRLTQLVFGLPRSDFQRVVAEMVGRERQSPSVASSRSPASADQKAIAATKRPVPASVGSRGKAVYVLALKNHLKQKARSAAPAAAAAGGGDAGR